MRVLGLDYGSRHIGVALGDTDSRIASPWGVIDYENRSDALERIHSIIRQDAVSAIVVGVPHILRDTSQITAQIREARSFLQDVEKFGIPVHETDETMSTKLAAVYMRDRNEKGKRDDMAAVVILQTWLDTKPSLENE